MKNFKDFCNEEQWSGDVKTKKHPKEDLFAEGTAKQIADWTIKSHKDLRGAIAALNFYINRAGDKLEADRKKVIEDAKDLVHKHYGVNESRNLVDIEADIKYLLAHPEKDDYKLVKLEKEYKKAGGEKSLGVLSKELVHKHFGVNESTNNDLAKDIFNLLSSAWFESFYENEFTSFIEGDEDALPKEKIISMIASRLK